MKNERDKTNSPKLLLHACCAPCSTSVYEKLCGDFELTLYWYNPNIYPKSEHDKRLEELVKLSKILGFFLVIDSESELDHDQWLNYKSINKFASAREGEKRCSLCYQMRLEKVFDYATQNDFDYFGSTLTVSPYKNSPEIIRIAKELENGNVKFLDKDFKEESGYKRSVELSKKFKLYRQKYCGCEYSQRVSSKSKTQNSN